jgi:hypothetical protein
VAPALWRLTFAALIAWVVLNVGGSGLAVDLVPTYTCRACDLAPVVLPCPAGRFFSLLLSEETRSPPSMIQPTVGENTVSDSDLGIISRKHWPWFT